MRMLEGVPPRDVVFSLKTLDLPRGPPSAATQVNYPPLQPIPLNADADPDSGGPAPATMLLYLSRSVRGAISWWRAMSTAGIGAA